MAPVHDVKNNLILAMNDPDVQLYTDEFIVIIADLYPKSRHHYLVMPKEDIHDVRSLQAKHIPKLIYMELKGLEYVMRKTGLSAQNFMIGYHSYPSMNRLHLHILSKDFNSVHMKLSYQWNLFHTEFFLPTYKLISELQTIGHAVLPPNKKCLNQPPRCYKCDYFSNNLENLKMHMTLFHTF